MSKKITHGRIGPGWRVFVPGAMVIATLSNPREKFWGMILALAAEGLSLSGTELASFEDLTVMVRDGEPFHSRCRLLPDASHRARGTRLTRWKLAVAFPALPQQDGLGSSNRAIAKPAPGAGETNAQTSNAFKEPS